MLLGWDDNFEVYGLPTRRHADQAADLLSIKAAFEEGQPLDGLPLRSRAEPFSNDELTEAGRHELVGITFEELFAQIVDWVKEMRIFDIKPTLLYQPAEGRSLVGTRLLLLLDPAAASRADAPWPGACPLSAACRQREVRTRLPVAAAQRLLFEQLQE
ncbi:hypothetical protein ABPG77_002149 [Micractinium sp. CCAP 211/92]